MCNEPFLKTKLDNYINIKKKTMGIKIVIKNCFEEMHNAGAQIFFLL